MPHYRMTSPAITATITYISLIAHEREHTDTSRHFARACRAWPDRAANDERDAEH